MDRSALVGREQERRMFLDLIEQKKSVLIVGDEGVGKSALLKDVVAAGEHR